jgi:hypothetical protein
VKGTRARVAFFYICAYLTCSRGHGGGVPCLRVHRRDLQGRRPREAPLEGRL